MLRIPVRRNKLGFPIVALACLASVTWIAGCGGNPDLADVRGVVTLDGQPLPDAFIMFTPEGGVGTVSFGQSTSDGSYRMRFTEKEYGAFIGSNKVSIGTGDVSSDGTGKVKEVVPKVYNTETTLVADVKSGKNTFDFDLKSDAAKIEQFRDDDQ
jgi:hypothetical protein